MQQGGAGGTGGYSVDVGSNELGKMATYVPGSCPQRGGEYPAIPVHTASYSLTDPVLLDSGARYMSHKGGSRRRRNKNRKQSRRVRRQ
jgi:hypothetical protein